MSNELAKYLNSRRRFRDLTAIKKQEKIAKQHKHIKTEYNPKLDQPHRYAKHHAMDCGNPKCFVCSNPRKSHKDKLTYQEKKLFQNIDKNINNEDIC
jgi:hypothetical protein